MGPPSCIVPALLPVDARKPCKGQSVSNEVYIEHSVATYVNEWEGPLRRKIRFKISDAKALNILSAESNGGGCLIVRLGLT